MDDRRLDRAEAMRTPSAKRKMKHQSRPCFVIADDYDRLALYRLKRSRQCSQRLCEHFKIVPVTGVMEYRSSRVREETTQGTSPVASPVVRLKSSLRCPNARAGFCEFLR